jgi:hypothetical protein
MPRGGRRPGSGRKAGVPNKITATLKDAILEAARLEGGEEGLIGYLRKLAAGNSTAFAALMGKVLPLQLQGDASNPVNISFSWKRPSSET